MCCEKKEIRHFSRELNGFKKYLRFTKSHRKSQGLDYNKYFKLLLTVRR